MESQTRTKRAGFGEPKAGLCDLEKEGTGYLIFAAMLLVLQ